MYASTMKVDPVIKELNREHEEVLRIHSTNPGERYSEVARVYFQRKRDRESEEYKKMIMGSRSTAASVDYMPTKAARKRMDSEHLNSWMTRGEIQEVAERYEEYKKLLKDTKYVT